MFAYCNNNPVNCCDPSGHIPYFIDDPAGEAGKEIGEWIASVIKTDENETDENGQLTLKAKLKRIGIAFFECLDLSIDVGQGYYAEGTALDMGLAGGMYGNYFALQYSDGTWSWGQELVTGASISFTQLLEFGFSEYEFIQSGETVASDMWYGMNTSKDSWTLFSAAFYFIAGGSVSVAFDLNTFLAELSRTLGGG